MRLDEYLVKIMGVESRNVANQLIKNEFILVNNVICSKKNLNITNQEVKIINELKYVSRAGLKLEYAIDKFNINLKDKVVLDVGASTGGFTDCCIKNGAKNVIALDVGTDQLHKSLINNEKVVNLSNTNVKDLSCEIIKNKVIDCVVSDISFISSKYLFDNLKKINLVKGANIISLIKPQFELNKEILDKCKGKITEKKHHDEAINNVIGYAKNNGFKVIEVIESPLTGAKMKNKEFIIWCKYE